MSPRDRSRERGIALVTTLLVVALLTILVVEFTYTIQVENHMSRNALNALQATYLARSGINVLAGALVKDNSPRFDPDPDDDEEMWRSFLPGIGSDADTEGCVHLTALEDQLPPTWKLCVRITDESGKINVNMTKPRVPPPNPTPNACSGNNEVCWREALKSLLRGHDDDDAVVDSLRDYWAKAPAPRKGQATQPYAPDFDSTEDFAAAFPELRAPEVFSVVRDFTTALPITVQRGPPRVTTVNINTASRDVLQAILGANGADDGTVDDIMTQRQDDKQMKTTKSLLTGPAAKLQALFGYNSSYFRLESSAVVNGVGKTVRAMVRRDPGAPKPGVAAGTYSWRLTFLDWKKEGGATLIDHPAELDPNAFAPGSQSGNKMR